VSLNNKLKDKRSILNKITLGATRRKDVKSRNLLYSHKDYKPDERNGTIFLAMPQARHAEIQA
jgi:hypothetical protein